MFTRIVKRLTHPTAQLAAAHPRGSATLAGAAAFAMAMLPCAGGALANGGIRPLDEQIIIQPRIDPATLVDNSGGYPQEVAAMLADVLLKASAEHRGRLITLTIEGAPLQFGQLTEEQKLRVIAITPGSAKPERWYTAQVAERLSSAIAEARSGGADLISVLGLPLERSVTPGFGLDELNAALFPVIENLDAFVTPRTFILSASVQEVDMAQRSLPTAFAMSNDQPIIYRANRSWRGYFPGETELSGRWNSELLIGLEMDTLSEGGVAWQTRTSDIHPGAVAYEQQKMAANNALMLADTSGAPTTHGNDNWGSRPSTGGGAGGGGWGGTGGGGEAGTRGARPSSAAPANTPSADREPDRTEPGTTPRPGGSPRPAHAPHDGRPDTSNDDEDPEDAGPTDPAEEEFVPKRLLHYQNVGFGHNGTPGLVHPMVCNPEQGWNAHVTNTLEFLIAELGPDTFDWWGHRTGGEWVELGEIQLSNILTTTTRFEAMDIAAQAFPQLTDMSPLRNFAEANGINLYGYIGFPRVDTGSPFVFTPEPEHAQLAHMPRWYGPFVDAHFKGVGHDWSAALPPSSNVFTVNFEYMRANGIEPILEAIPWRARPYLLGFDVCAEEASFERAVQNSHLVYQEDELNAAGGRTIHLLTTPPPSYQWSTYQDLLEWRWEIAQRYLRQGKTIAVPLKDFIVAGYPVDVLVELAREPVE